ncbi:MAG TPA: mevalonate kinase [Anaerolineales bacterium]|nr:mevalonate kinase [Anaerolineales bacterium]
MNSALAPGKIILFGEHAVVYGRPALAVPVTQVRAEVEVWPSEYRGVWIDAPDIRLKAELKEVEFDHPLAASLRTLFSELGVDPCPNINIRIRSTIPVASGLGSGAAVSVALARALCAYIGQPASDDQVNRLAFEMEKVYHGTPSGIDNTVITYAKPVYFLRGQPIKTFKPRKPFTIVIGDTGVAASTREAVADLRSLWEKDRRTWDAIFTRVGQIVDEARRAIEYGKIRALGELMDQNQDLLQHMTMSSLELERLIEAARDAGALGAKLSGAGRGGNMIALAEPSAASVSAIRDCLMSAGARRVITTTVG